MSRTILGLDPSLRNWGIVKCLYDTTTHHLELVDSHIIQTKSDKSKKRQNIKDLITAHTLYKQLKPYVLNVDAICIELPHGSQSSRAMVSYGVCIGVLASIADLNPKMVVVSANEVKAVVGANTASKAEIIDWVKQHHPHELEFIPKTKKAEHICDALLSIYASIHKPLFKEYTQ